MKKDVKDTNGDVIAEQHVNEGVRIGRSDLVFGIPKWVARLVGCDTNMLQMVTITFRNDDFAHAQIDSIADEADVPDDILNQIFGIALQEATVEVEPEEETAVCINCGGIWHPAGMDPAYCENCNYTE